MLIDTIHPATCLTPVGGVGRKYFSSRTRLGLSAAFG